MRMPYNTTRIAVLVTLLPAIAVAQESSTVFWKELPTATAVSFRGLHALNSSQAWACGSKGTVVSTSDGGQTWAIRSIDGLQETELRSIHAWSAAELVVATAGTPCRIYRSEDAGQSWRVVYENLDPHAFINGMRFWNAGVGFAFGDPIASRLMAWISEDRGRSWRESSLLPVPLATGEAGFAASNSSLLLFGEQSVWIGLGGAVGSAQVFMSDDRGASWQRSAVPPISSGPSSGIFSLARSPDGTVIAVGGDFMDPERETGNAAIFDPGTRQWHAPQGRPPRGYRSAIVYLPQPLAIAVQSDRAERPALGLIRWIAVGPGGSDWSSDGEHWQPLSEEPFHALSLAADGSLWASGARGRIAISVQAP